MNINPELWNCSVIHMHREILNSFLEECPYPIILRVELVYVNVRRLLRVRVPVEGDPRNPEYIHIYFFGSSWQLCAHSLV